MRVISSVIILLILILSGRFDCLRSDWCPATTLVRLGLSPSLQALAVGHLELPGGGLARLHHDLLGVVLGGRGGDGGTGGVQGWRGQQREVGRGEVGGGGDQQGLDGLQWVGHCLQQLHARVAQHLLGAVQDLQLLHLQLPDGVVAVGDQILPHLGQGVGHPGVGLCRGGECHDFYMKIIIEVVVLGVLR